RLISNLPTLRRHAAQWKDDGSGPLGFVLSMEGADPIPGPEHVEGWWNDGLRIVSLCHYGLSGYAHGTGQPGGLTERAKPLLRELERVGMILDVTHLADEAFFQALDA